MIRKTLLSVVLVVFAATIVQAALAQMGGDKAPSPVTITGCVQKGSESEGFYLISTKGKHWELYPNSDISLADHVGHTVTVTGTVAHRSEGQEKVSQPHEKKEMGERKHADLQVSSLKMVSDSCK